MTVTYSKSITRDDQKQVYCELYADTVPSPLPSVTDIPGYEDCDQIAVGSWLMIVSTGDIYIANEQGEFVEQ